MKAIYDHTKFPMAVILTPETVQERLALEAFKDNKAIHGVYLELQKVGGGEENSLTEHPDFELFLTTDLDTATDD